MQQDLAKDRDPTSLSSHSFRDEAKAAIQEARQSLQKELESDPLTVIILKAIRDQSLKDNVEIVRQKKGCIVDKLLSLGKSPSEEGQEALRKVSREHIELSINGARMFAESTTEYDHSLSLLNNALQNLHGLGLITLNPTFGLEPYTFLSPAGVRKPKTAQLTKRGEALLVAIESTDEPETKQTKTQTPTNHQT